MAYLPPCEELDELEREGINTGEDLKSMRGALVLQRGIFV
jgi:hypothetical protein